MYWLLAIIGLALVLSLIEGREETLQALKISYKRFINILPAILIMLILVSIVFFLVPEVVISEYLGADNKFAGVRYMIGATIRTACAMLLELMFTIIPRETERLSDIQDAKSALIQADRNGCQKVPEPSLRKNGQDSL